MRNFYQENIGLVAMRQYRYDKVKVYNYVFCVKELSDTRMFISNRGAGFTFPLYIYQNSRRESNIRKSITDALKKNYSAEIKSEKIFYYIYAVLYSNIYRKKFSQYLKVDFPRVPFTSDYDLFSKIVKLGNTLVDLHLMRSEELQIPTVKFQGDGDNTIDKPIFDKEKERIYINETQFFDGINKSIWEYQIGGYQVLRRWLRYRKGRKLSLENIKHLCKVATTLKRTIEIQDEIDKLYTNVEKDVILFEEENVSIDKYTK